MKEQVISSFITALNGGGAQKVVVNLANALVELTDRPIHIVLARSEGEFIDEVRAEVKSIDPGKGRASRSISALERYLREVHPAVLCSSLDYANVCAVLAWQLTGPLCRLVVREDNVVRVPNGGLRSFFRSSATQGLMRLFYPRANAVVAISEAVACTLSDRNIFRQSQIRVIGNPITLKVDRESSSAEQLPALSKRDYICAIGRLAEAKDFDALLQAFALMRGQNVDLVILGEGPLRAELTKQAERLGIADRVHMPGFVSEPERVLSRAMLFVLSSRWEGFGNALVEALATGVPIVSTDCPGAPRSLLRDGALGHLVPVDEPEALARAIAEALHSPRGTREARQARAGEFAAPTIARQYLKEAFGLEACARAGSRDS